MLRAPQTGEHLKVEVLESEKLLILTLNRPKQLNSMTEALEADLTKTLDWFEQQPSLWVLIVTGAGTKAFCAGQDLKDWLSRQTEAQASGTTAAQGGARILGKPNGFGSLSSRRSKKVMIVALNGLALGGGAELLSNFDIVIGAAGQVIGFPEVRRGVVASVGGIPNGIRRAPQIAPYILTGLPIPSKLVAQYLLTEEVPTTADVMPAARKWAARVVECSPDAVQLTKSQINLAILDGKGVLDTVKSSAEDPESDALYSGENILEGLKAFTEKRATVWKDPKPLKSKL